VPQLGFVRGPALTVIREAPLPDDLSSLEPLIARRLEPDAHGDMPRWLAALAALPPLVADRVEFGDTVRVDGAATAAQRAGLASALRELHPWRKGPFSLFGVDIDTEWRSDWKWARVAAHVTPLPGRRVLDVGCGNGYFGWRMLGAGAREVIGVDPTLVFALQHRAVNAYIDSDGNRVLPVRFEELPPCRFDTAFSMGVIYHRRDPAEHAARLWSHLRPGGEVVVETLVVGGSEPLQPPRRYARMRNVWTVPTVELLLQWLEGAGFVDARVVDVTPTTTDEQRSTDWMRFESLAEAVDPHDPTRTVEGLPAPVRAVAVALKPG
jgi:tRNA (mo5U34)-methyltransferase